MLAASLWTLAACIVLTIRRVSLTNIMEAAGALLRQEAVSGNEAQGDPLMADSMTLVQQRAALEEETPAPGYLTPPRNKRAGFPVFPFCIDSMQRSLPQHAAAAPFRACSAARRHLSENRRASANTTMACCMNTARR